MNEAKWLAATDPGAMLAFLRGKASDRRLRLFAVACCQQLMPWNNNKRVQDALSRAERYADGGLAESTMEKWSQEVNRINYGLLLKMGGGGSAQTTICGAVSSVCLPRRYAGFVNVWQALVNFGGVFSPEFETRSPAIVRALLDDIFANPFRPVAVDPSWLTSTVVGLAESVYQQRAFHDLPILADALEEAGCDRGDVLGHCRDLGGHVRGCWVVDLLTGRG